MAKAAPLDSLKESGDLEYAADVVLFLTEAQERMATPPARAVELTVAKNRHGDTGKIGLIFRPDLGRCTRRRGHEYVRGHARENLTLTEADLAACRPIGGEGGHVLQASAFHGSDRQRSLRVQVYSGRFVCFACGAWGYMETARARWREEQQRQGPTPSPVTTAAFQVASGSGPGHPPPISTHRMRLRRGGQTSLTSLLRFRPPCRGAVAPPTCNSGIPLALAQQHGVGYAGPGTWPHATRDWRGGRVVFPHTTPDGRLVNLYGRAVGPEAQVPKAKRHDHLPGAKGYFNATALQAGIEPLWVCEGAFDALALLAAGVPRVVAIFGVQGWRWDWVREVRALVFALDADAAGQQQWRQLARQAALREAGGRAPSRSVWGARMSAKPGRRGCWRPARGLCSTGRRDPRCASAPVRTLGGARRDHGHRRRHPVRGRRAPGVGGAPDPRRRAVRGELPRWDRRPGQGRGSGAAGRSLTPRCRRVSPEAHWGAASCEALGHGVGAPGTHHAGSTHEEAVAPLPTPFRLAPRPYQYEAWPPSSPPPRGGPPAPARVATGTGKTIVFALLVQRRRGRSL